MSANHPSCWGTTMLRDEATEQDTCLQVIFIDVFWYPISTPHDFLDFIAVLIQICQLVLEVLCTWETDESPCT